MNIRVVYEKCGYSLYVGGSLVRDYSRMGKYRALVDAEMASRVLSLVGRDSKIVFDESQLAYRRKYLRKGATK